MVREVALCSCHSTIPTSCRLTLGAAALDTKD